jgi:hypothetical protein
MGAAIANSTIACARDPNKFCFREILFINIASIYSKKYESAIYYLTLKPPQKGGPVSLLLARDYTTQCGFATRFRPWVFASQKNSFNFQGRSMQKMNRQ